MAKSIHEVALEVIQGKWGNGDERVYRLGAAGYNAWTVQQEVNRILGTPAPASAGINAVAREVIQGKWGNGLERRQKLEAAGYDYAAVQAEVGRLMALDQKK